MTDFLEVQEPGLAGRWYPAEAARLAAMVDGLLAVGGAARPGVIAIIAPHAAYQYSGSTAARAYAALGAGHRRAVVLAPSHAVPFRGAAVLAAAAYRTPIGLVPIDREAVAAIAAAPLVEANAAVFQREHSLEIQLPLLQTADPGCALVPVLVGRLERGDASALAAVLAPLLEPGSVLVVSSDFVHYGRGFDYLPVPPTDAESVTAGIRRVDEGALERILARDPDGFARYVEATGATICGHHPIEVLLHALPAGARGERLGYTTSLEITGDYEERVVSYAAVAFTGSAS